jgi:hypothetical protein
VARVPQKQFDSLVEASKPATIKELAAIGASRIGIPEDYLKGRDPKDYQVGMYGRGALRHFVDECNTYPAKQVVRGSIRRDIPRVLSDIAKARRWLDTVEQLIGDVPDEY